MGAELELFVNKVISTWTLDNENDKRKKRLVKRLIRWLFPELAMALDNLCLNWSYPW